MESRLQEMGAGSDSRGRSRVRVARGPGQVQNLQGRLAGLRTRPPHSASPPLTWLGYPQEASFTLLSTVRW